MGKLRRKQVTERYGSIYFSGPVTEIIDELNTLLLKLGESAFVENSDPWDDSSFAIYYHREETDKELNKRQRAHDKELKKEQKRKEELEEYERAQYAILKAKFENEDV